MLSSDKHDSRHDSRHMDQGTIQGMTPGVIHGIPQGVIYAITQGVVEDDSRLQGFKAPRRHSRWFKAWLFQDDSRQCNWNLGSSTAANWVSFDLNVSCSSCWGYSLINTLKLNYGQCLGDMDCLASTHTHMHCLASKHTHMHCLSCGLPSRCPKHWCLQTCVQITLGVNERERVCTHVDVCVCVCLRLCVNVCYECVLPVNVCYLPCVVPAMCTHLVCICPSVYMQGSPCVCLVCPPCACVSEWDTEQTRERERETVCVGMCLLGWCGCNMLQRVAVSCCRLLCVTALGWLDVNDLQWVAVCCHVLPCLNDVIQMSLCRGLQMLQRTYTHTRTHTQANARKYTPSHTHSRIHTQAHIYTHTYT